MKYHVAMSVIMAVSLLLEAIALFLIYHFMIQHDNKRIQNIKVQKTVDILTKLSELVKSFSFINYRNAAVFSILDSQLLSRADFTTVLQYDQYENDAYLEGFNYLPMISGEAQINAFNDFATKNIQDTCHLKALNVGYNNSSPISPGKFTTLNDTNRTYFPLLYYYPVYINNALVADIQCVDFQSTMFGGMLLKEMLTNINYTSLSLSSRVSLIVKDANPFNNYGVYMTVPVKSNTDKRFLGFMNVVIRISKLLNETIVNTGSSTNDLDILVFDKVDDTVLYNVNPYAYITSSTQLTPEFMKNAIQYDLPFNNRRYLFVFKFRPSFNRKFINRSIFILVISLMSSFILVDVILILLYRFVLLYYRTKHNLVKQKQTEDMLLYCNHEFRNPLNIVKGLVGYQLHRLQSSSSVDREELTHDLKIANSSCEFLEHIINDLITVQKLESNVIVMDNQFILLRQLIQSVMDSMTQKSEEKSDLYLSVSCQQNLLIYVDAMRLKQILTNLVSNAIKYTYTGHIIVSAHRGVNDCIVIKLEDTGTGIPANKQHLIFQKDIVVDRKDINRNGSHGIGLYLCKLLCNRMSIDLSFRSSPSGTTFFLIIPQQI